MYTLKGIEQFVNEGVYDPGKLKAVFMAGGAGSGKSYVATELFAIDRNTMARTAASGLKVINTDDVIEFLAKKDGIDLKDIQNWSPEETGKYFARSTKRINMLQKWFQDGRLGLLIDTTASNTTKVSNQKKKLEELGYDCFMVFVDTPLETALKRNSERDRVLSDAKVIGSWNNVQEAKEELVKIFAPHYVIIDNDGIKDIGKQGQKAVDNFLRTPIMNPIGIQWIANATALRSMANK